VLPQGAPAPEQPASSPAAADAPTADALGPEAVVAALMGEDATAAGAAAPAIVSSPNATTVRLPFQGTLEGMTSRIWADPYALAIDLPNGSSSVELGRHALTDPEGIVSLVRLQAKGRALLVRLNLKRPIASHSVALTRGWLELHVVASNAGSSSLTVPQ
jgi:hypothetical protein